MEKERKRASICEEGDGGGGGVLPHDLVAEEILSRLPAKSLMRFKCVSKLWLSTILHPRFHQSHRSRRPKALLIACPHRGFFNGAAAAAAAALEPHHQFTIPNKSVSSYDGVTEVVQGLVCLYKEDRSWICSVSTGETMELPRSSKHNHNLDHLVYKYYLGFDWYLKQYKVLKVCTFCRRPSTRGGGRPYYVSQSEIITLGLHEEDEEDEDEDEDEEYPSSWWSWMTYPVSPVIDLEKGSLYVDMGYRDLFSYADLYWWQFNGKYIISFSFQHHCQGFVGVPLPRHVRRYGGAGASLHQFGGRQALVTSLADRKLEMWIHRGPMGKEDNFGWIKWVIGIPYAIADRGCSLLGYLPTGETLITHTPQEEEETDNFMPPVYSYDPAKDKFQKLEIGSSFTSSPALMGQHIDKLRIYFYEEDIRPLSHLISNK